MAVVVITEFTNAIKFFTKEKLLDLTVLTGYGMACGGDGTVGTYKLKIDIYMIASRMQFATKLDIGCHERIQAAGLIDFTLDYYNKIFNQYYNK